MKLFCFLPNCLEFGLSVRQADRILANMVFIVSEHVHPYAVQTHHTLKNLTRVTADMFGEDYSHSADRTMGFDKLQKHGCFPHFCSDTSSPASPQALIITKRVF